MTGKALHSRRSQSRPIILSKRSRILLISRMTSQKDRIVSKPAGAMAGCGRGHLGAAEAEARACCWLWRRVQGKRALCTGLLKASTERLGAPGRRHDTRRERAQGQGGTTLVAFKAGAGPRKKRPGEKNKKRAKEQKGSKNERPAPVEATRVVPP